MRARSMLDEVVYIAIETPDSRKPWSERVCEAQTPVGSSVTGSCVHVAHIANDGQERDIMEWHAEEDVLHIRDPYLLFFMRWGE